MKKMVKTIIIGILSAALLAGCGNNTQKNSEAVEPAPTATNAPTADITASEVLTPTADITASEAPVETTLNLESQSAEGIYRVHVTDIHGEPVAGVKLQFCSADLCTFGTTDNSGYAEFDQPEGQTYETHLFKVPQGYLKDENVYQVPDKYTTVEIVLQTESNIDTGTEKVTEPDVKDFSSVGLKYCAKGAYADTKGTIIPVYAESFPESDPYVWAFRQVYYAYPESEIADVMKYADDYIDASETGAPIPKAPKESWERWSESIGDLYYVFAINYGKGMDELKNSEGKLLEDPIDWAAPELYKEYFDKYLGK